MTEARVAANPPARTCLATWCEDDACTADHPEPADPLAQAVAALRGARMLAEETRP
jgi:hypothetical protein